MFPESRSWGLRDRKAFRAGRKSGGNIKRINILYFYLLGGLRGQKTPSVRAGMNSPLTFKYFFVKHSINGSH